MEDEKIELTLGELEIPPEGLLKKELQDEIENRIAYTVKDLFLLEDELKNFVELVRTEVESNKDSPDALKTLYNYIDEMWSVIITNELRDILLDTLSVVQEQKHELEDIMKN